MELAIQREMSRALTDTPKAQVNVPNRVQLSTDNARTKTTVAGAMESGRIARALEIKNAASLVGMDIRTRRLTTVRMVRSRSLVNDAVHRRIVMNFFRIIVKRF